MRCPTTVWYLLIPQYWNFNDFPKVQWCNCRPLLLLLSRISKFRNPKIKILCEREILATLSVPRNTNSKYLFSFLYISLFRDAQILWRTKNYSHHVTFLGAAIFLSTSVKDILEAIWSYFGLSVLKTML